MKLVVLAAGRGSRLQAHLEDMPKPLAPLADGSTLLGKHLDRAERSGCFDEVVIVTGYRFAKVDEFLARVPRSLPVRSIYNPFYAFSGPVVSLWVAREILLGEDFAIANGDTVYAEDVYRAACVEGEGARLVVSGIEAPEPDMVRVTVGQDGLIKQVGKRLSNAETSGVSAGLLFVRGEAIRREFVSHIDAFVREEGFPERVRVWHDIVHAMARDGVRVEPIVTPLSNWREVDDSEDYHAFNETALTIFPG